MAKKILTQQGRHNMNGTIKKEAKGKELSMEELDKITGGARVIGTGENDFLSGTGGDDRIYGYVGDDVIHGGDGNDKLNGGHGSDVLMGGDGNDTLDGGNRDGASDVAMGGEGDDTYLWRVATEGNDTFIGGPGNDTIKLWDLGRGTLESKFNDGSFDIMVKNESGNPVNITSDMFDDQGNLTLPPGSYGVITGPQGETLTFEGVETITKYYR